MTRYYLNVISELDTDGALWPRIVYYDNRWLDVDRVFHTFTIESNMPGTPVWCSYRCLIKGKTMNVTLEEKTNRWFLSQHGKSLFY